MPSFSPSSRTDPAGLAGLAATVLAHIAIVLFLFTYAPVRDALKAMAPLMVELIKPKLTVPPAPKIEPSKPLPVKRLQAPPDRPVTPVVVAAQTAAPAAMEVPVQPEPKPAPPVVAEAKLAPPVPVTPPNFNADYLDNPAPAYPALSRRMGEQGRVLLRVYVDVDGAPSKLEVRSSSGSERLDQSALDAVRRWKFAPAKQGDKAVAAWVVVPISFNLKG